MKTIKEFFLKNKAWILIGFTVILFSVVATCQHSENRAEVKALKAEQAKNELKIRNEEQSFYLERENKIIDSLKNIEANKTFKLQTDNLIYRSENQRLKQVTTEQEVRFNKMVELDTPCPELLEAALIRIDTLKLQVFVYENRCKTLEETTHSLSLHLKLFEKKCANLDTLLASARAEVKAGDLVISSLKNVEKKKEFKRKAKEVIAGGVILVETVLLIVKSI